MTTRQVMAETKDITRRFGWWFLKPGDRIQAVEKAMGLKKGEKINRLKLIEVVSTRSEPLNTITPEDVIREGFPGWTPEQFVQMRVDHYRINPDRAVNRIEFRYCQEKQEQLLLFGYPWLHSHKSFYSTSMGAEP
ncbi:MAG: hypothetical protein KDI44_16375 [Thiothrix sp.]|nr:hypothetical protein [Thiothrix sp.]